MVSRVRTKCGDQGRFQRVILLPKVMQCPAEREDIVKDDTVGDEVVVLDDLALLIPVIGGNGSIPTKGQPLQEPIEGLALVGVGLDK